MNMRDTENVNSEVKGITGIAGSLGHRWRNFPRRNWSWIGLENPRYVQVGGEWGSTEKESIPRRRQHELYQAQKSNRKYLFD